MRYTNSKRPPSAIKINQKAYLDSRNNIGGDGLNGGNGSRGRRQRNTKRRTKEKEEERWLLQRKDETQEGGFIRFK